MKVYGWGIATAELDRVLDVGPLTCGPVFQTRAPLVKSGIDSLSLWCKLDFLDAQMAVEKQHFRHMLSTRTACSKLVTVCVRNADPYHITPPFLLHCRGQVGPKCITFLENFVYGCILVNSNYFLAF